MKPKAENKKTDISTNHQPESKEPSNETGKVKKIASHNRPSKVRVAANFNFPGNDVDNE